MFDSRKPYLVPYIGFRLLPREPQQKDSIFETVFLPGVRNFSTDPHFRHASDPRYSVTTAALAPSRRLIAALQS